MVLAGALTAFFHPEIPAWGLRGTTSYPVAPLSQDPGLSLCPRAGETIELRGDSLVAGARMGDRRGAGAAYGQVLKRELGDGASVVLRGVGGARASDGATAAPALSGAGDIILLAYGTNDAAVRGWIGGKQPVTLAAFRASLTAHVAEARRSGARVGLIAPPPVGSAAMAARLQPFREAVSDVGRRNDIPVFDPARAFAGCRGDEPLLLHDALHLNASGHACLGRWLAQRMCR